MKSVNVVGLAIFSILMGGHASAADAPGPDEGDVAESAAAEDGEAAANGAKGTERREPDSTWNGHLAGDSVRLMVNAYGLQVYGGSSERKRCAAAQSRARVVSDDGKVLTLRFTYVARKTNTPTFGNDPHSYAACPATKSVSEGVQYVIDRAAFLGYDHRLVGISFGGLVVPFKYYLGGDKRLTGSSTVAPYLGLNLPFVLGTTLTPILSAGLGLVPVESNTGEASGTRSALSTAIGFVLTSSKHDSFNSGIVFGRDWIGNNDRGTDDTVNKPWFSIYVGYSPK